MSSRVAFPERNTASTLLRVYWPSGLNSPAWTTALGSDASSSTEIRLPGHRPPETIDNAERKPPR